MIRLLALGSLLLLTGCPIAGVPAAVVWTTVGAGLGATAAVVNLDTEGLKVWDERHPPVAKP